MTSTPRDDHDRTADRPTTEQDRPEVTPVVRNDSLIDPGIVTAMGVGDHPGIEDDDLPERPGRDHTDALAEKRSGTPDPRGY